MNGKQKQQFYAVIGIGLALAALVIYGSQGPSSPVEFTVGTTTVYSETHGEAGKLRAVRHVAPQSGELKSLHIYIEALSTGKLGMAVYSSVGGEVGTLLYETGDITVESGFEGWVVMEVTEIVAIVEGESYYIAELASCADLLFHWSADIGVHLVWYRTTYGKFPTTFTPELVGDDDISMYMMCETT